MHFGTGRTEICPYWFQSGLQSNPSCCLHVRPVWDLSSPQIWIRSKSPYRNFSPVSKIHVNARWTEILQNGRLSCVVHVILAFVSNKSTARLRPPRTELHPYRILCKHFRFFRPAWLQTGLKKACKQGLRF